jgi:acyl-CoA synthetase (AMP-forming)/AMP-acid ligase II
MVRIGAKDMSGVTWRTVGEMLGDRAQRHPERTFARFHPSSGDRDLTYGDAWVLACRWADLFESLGLDPSQPVLLALPNGTDFVGAFFGATLAGLIPAPSIPHRTISADAYGSFLTSRAASIGATVVVGTPEQCLDEDPSSIRLVTSLQLEESTSRREPQTRAAAGLYQFTSGTSGRAKAVVLTHEALLFQASVIARSLRVVPDDIGVSWLPLFHDMGLFGFLLTPISIGASVFLLRTEMFAQRPRIWMETVARERGTITSGPPSAYVLAARCARQNLDLTSVRAAVVGAERIMPAALQTIHDALGPLGLSWSALMPAYGMAEVGAAATITALNRGPRVEVIDARRFQVNGEASPVRGDGHGVVSCGVPVESTEIRIVDEAGQSLPERCVGHVTIRSRSQTAGHMVDRSLDTTSLRDGWLLTGDQGYVADGEVFITGRLRDVLVVGGEKFVPEDFEQAALAVKGVRPGAVVAVSQLSQRVGAEQVTLLVESAVADESSRQELTIAIRQSLSRRALPVGDVILVPPKTITRTPNGKLPRAWCQERLLAGEFHP